jgi:hypothetical protein
VLGVPAYRQLPPDGDGANASLKIGEVSDNLVKRKAERKELLESRLRSKGLRQL